MTEEIKYYDNGNLRSKYSVNSESQDLLIKYSILDEEKERERKETFKDGKIIRGDCVKELKKIKNEYFDLSVFSPPYDNLREYKGFNFDLHELGEQLYRTTKKGGVVVMVIQDQTIKGHKSLTSFRTIVDWCDNVGFGLFECNIYKKNGKDGAWWKNRFRVDHEYMPIFVKGEKPKTFKKDCIKIPSKHAGKTMKGGANRNKDGLTINSSRIKINNTKCRGTIFDYSNGGDKINLKRQHPATFPDKIPYDFIRVFSNEGDLILDPMAGSGSTLVTAKILKRNYLGIEISEEYCKLAQQRVDTLQSNVLKEFKNKF